MTDRLTRNRSKYWPDKTLHDIKLEEPKMDSKLSEDEIIISKPKKLKTSPKLPVSTKAVKSIELPPNWKVIYDNIVQMRKETPAVVDTMGCSHWADKNIDPKVSRFQVLVSLMLSSQTRDEVTYATMVELKKNGLSVEYIDNISTSELEAMINKVGFYRRKAAFIKKTANTLKEVYDGDIPSTLEELIKLPGVGPKMANLTMQEAWNKVTGIAVDTHVHRITNRLKWVKTKTPEQTQAELEAKVPREHWRDFNHLLVGFGQSICRPVKPKCPECLNCTICPSSTDKYLF